MILDALNEQDVNNSLIMIQPTPTPSTLLCPSRAVLFDSVSIKHDLSSSILFSTFSSSTEDLSLNGGIEDIKKDMKTLRNYLKFPLPRPPG